VNALERSALILILFVTAIAAPLTIFAGLGIAVAFGLVIAIPSLFMIHYTKWQVITRLPLLVSVTFLFTWMGCSVFWSLNPLYSFETWLQFGAFVIGGVSLGWFLACQDERFINNIGTVSLVSLIVTIGIIMFELMTEGRLANTIQMDWLHKDDYVYFPHDMNRAATFIALFAWLPILHFSLNKEQPLVGVILWVAVLGVLGHMESLSATLGFFLGGITFILVWVLRFKGIPLMMGAIVLLIALHPILLPRIDPPAIMKIFPGIPESAEHRLYIWSFASDLAEQKDVQGWGLNASKYIEHDHSTWPREGLDPLPSHPHNFIVQVWLELGGVGLFFLISSMLAVLWGAQLHGWYRSQRAFTAAWWITYITISAFAYNFWQAWWMGTMLLTAGLGVGLMQPIQRKMMALRPR
jgi:O-antigen ligase